MAIVMTPSYSAQTEGARLVIERCFDLLNRALETAPVVEGARRFVDYGAADGGTSLELYRRVARAWSARTDGARVEMVLEDLPDNDFVSLGKHGRQALEGVHGAFLYLSPTSFYEPVVPDGTVSLGFSATAMHWLSRKPKLLLDHTHANATPVKEDREAFRSQARADFSALMARRAAELAPGGHLILVNLAESDDGRYLGHNGRDENMHEVLHHLWLALRDEGRISEEEYAAGTFQNFYKRSEDFLVPFADPSSPASRAGVRVVAERIDHVACPYRRRFDAGESDRASFARGLMQTVRSWGAHTFRSALAGRGAGEADALVDELYGRFEARIAAAPERFSMDYVEHYLHLRRET